jgi:hypothetical protein
MTKTVSINQELLDEQRIVELREWVTNTLHRGVTTVVFTKKDGTIRTMVCTLNESLMPVAHRPSERAMLSESDRANRKSNPDVRTCYDIEAGAWKSFRLDSIKTVTGDI